MASAGADTHLLSFMVGMPVVHGRGVVVLLAHEARAHPEPGHWRRPVLERLRVPQPGDDDPAGPGGRLRPRRERERDEAGHAGGP